MNLMPTGSPSHIPQKASALLLRIRERRTRTSSDLRLTKEIETQFETDQNNAAQGLSFYVCDGSVSVYGVVNSSTERDLVIQALSGIQGIRRITEHITLRD